jgi:hypothetical protein
MKTLIASALLVCAVAVPLTAEDEKGVTYLDLGPKTNQKLKEGYGDDANNLSELTAGEKTLAGVKFKIGTGLIMLSGKETENLPEKVEGIKLGEKCTKLHFLHATHYSAAKDDTIIGYYTVNYDDKSQETIPIVYGKDVLDWWYNDESKEPTRGKVAWKGDNENAKNNGSKIRLYLTTWKNPEPTKKVVSIDFGSTNSDRPAPFCVAITAQP